MNKIFELTIERLAADLYAAHVTVDGRKSIYLCDDLQSLPASLVRELATVRVRV